MSSVSGSLDLTNTAGKLDVVTVSGDARVHMGDTSEVRGRTTSGNLEVSGKLTRDGRVDVEGVSGDITLRLSAPGGLSTEIESFSGDIEGCLADNVERVSKYGPGTRLNIRTVEARRPRAREDAVGRYRHLRSLSGSIHRAADIATMSAACVFSNGFRWVSVRSSPSSCSACW